jgi:TP901 family phage tail tape measure protein
MRMRLSGGSEVAAEAEKATAAVEETSAATDKANKKVARSGSAISSSLSKQISGLKSIGRNLTKYVTVPLAAMAIGSAVSAAHFDRSMNLIATDAGGTVKEVSRLKPEVLDLARKTQYTGTELADALFHIESAGYRGANAMKVLATAAGLATAGNSDLERTTYGLVSAQKSLYGEGKNLQSVSQVKRTAAELNAIVSHGDIRLEELVAGMSSGLIEKAQEAGVSLRSVGSALDVMTARGIPAQRASYALGFIFSKLVPYTEPAVEAFEELGIQQEKLSKIAKGPGGWPAMIEFLSKKMQGLTSGQKQIDLSHMFGGGRMDVAVLASLQNMGDLNKKFEELNPNVALYNKHVKEAEQQPLVQAKNAWSSIDASLIELGQVILPAAIPLMHNVAGFVTGIAHDFAHLPPSTQQWVLKIALIAAVLGPILLLVAKLLKAWKTIAEMNLFSGLAGGVGELKAASELAAGGELGGFSMMGKAGRLTAGAGVGVAAQVAGHAIGGKGGSVVSDIGTGAGAGFAFGGPMGAAIGATGGAIMAALPEWEQLLGLTKQLSPMQQRVKSSSEELSAALSRQKTAGEGLTSANRRLDHAQANHNVSLKNVHKAQHALNEAVAQYGADSHPAIHAEARLTEEIGAHRRALKQLANAEKLHGVALSAYKTETDMTILAERHRINVLEQLRERQANLYQEAKAANPISQRTQTLAHNLLGTEGKLAEATKKHAETLSEAATKAGPKYAKFLNHATQEAVRFGGAMKATMTRVEGLTRHLEALTETEFNMPTVQPGNPLNLHIPGVTEPKGGGHRPHHKNTAADSGETHGSKAVEKLLERQTGRRGKLLPVTIALDPQGRRRLTEAVVEVQEDEDART